MYADDSKLTGGLGESDREPKQAAAPNPPEVTPQTGRGTETPLDEVAEQPTSELERREEEIRRADAARYRTGQSHPA